jgi:hypothetical protein
MVEVMSILFRVSRIMLEKVVIKKTMIAKETIPPV